MGVDTVKGNLLKADVDVVVHQLSSMPCKAHGLSKSIATRFKWADQYRQRTQMGNRNLATPETRPVCGSIVASFNPEDTGYPRAVVGIVGQLDFGRPGYKWSRVSPAEDSATKRLAWFQDGLVRTCEWAVAKGYKTVALPYLIGCGMAGGDWSRYAAIIDDVAALYPGLAVQLVKLGA